MIPPNAPAHLLPAHCLPVPQALRWSWGVHPEPQGLALDWGLCTQQKVGNRGEIVQMQQKVRDKKQGGEGACIAVGKKALWGGQGWVTGVRSCWTNTVWSCAEIGLHCHT